MSFKVGGWGGGGVVSLFLIFLILILLTNMTITMVNLNTFAKPKAIIPATEKEITLTQPACPAAELQINFHSFPLDGQKLYWDLLFFLML